MPTTERPRLLLLRILAPHFVAGVELFEGRAVRSAPILRYMMGWTLQSIRDYCKRKQWTLEEPPV